MSFKFPATPCDGEKMRILPRQILPPPLVSNVSAAAPRSLLEVPVTERIPAKSSSTKVVTILVAIIASAGLGVAGVKYGYRNEPLPILDRPLSVLKPIRQKLAPAVSVTPELLHVSATALGKVHLAIVNGKRLEEGDWLEVRTANGVAALHAVKIEDGVVHFGYVGETIDAKLQAEPARKTLTR